ncbi:MAG TPA: hypothetical protein VFR08_06110 [Candidatus Angelobacter sp.]|nr:hypothetical protein [Candidatus Angelobacter sp.]
MKVTMLSVPAVALLVILVPAWGQTASQSTQSAHSNAGREKGVIKQPQVEAAKADTKGFTALLISINGNGELLLSDAAGKKTGYDAQTHKNFQEIEGGSYDSADDIDDDEATPSATPAPGQSQEQPAPAAGGLKRIEVPEARAGEYNLKVSADQPGTYSLNVASLNDTGKQSTADFKNIVLGNTAPHYYRITVSGDPKKPLQVTRITETSKAKQ